MADKITRRQAWMKLAVLIADGLPDPEEIGFSDRSITVDLDSHDAYEAWIVAFKLEGRQQSAIDVDTAAGWKRLYRAWDNWHGWHLSVNAAIPTAGPVSEETTEDLTAVRDLAADDHDGPVAGCECDDCEDEREALQEKAASNG
jgi:hypothetical protein